MRTLTDSDKRHLAKAATMSLIVAAGLTAPSLVWEPWGDAGLARY